MDAWQVLSTTESVCPECLRVAAAERVLRSDVVYLRKTCPAHGVFETAVWRGADSYTGWVKPKIPAYPARPATAVTHGCPYDCGLCSDHRQQTCTALLEITQRCNLRCPVCFADAAHQPPPDPDLATIEGWYRMLLARNGPCNVQLSGGEPTVRADLPDIIRLGRELGFGFIQINTNGLRLAEDPAYAATLRAAGLSSVFLQFDGTEDGIYEALRGRPLLTQKIAAIENCAAHDIGVILVPVLKPGVNDHNIGDIIRLALRYAPAVRRAFPADQLLWSLPHRPHRRRPADHPGHDSGSGSAEQRAVQAGIVCATGLRECALFVSWQFCADARRPSRPLEQT